MTDPRAASAVAQAGMTDEERRRLTAFMEAAATVLPRYYAPQCCLAATRLAVEVLPRLQLAARPLAVKVAVHNPPLVAKGRLPASSQEAQLWRERDNAAMAVCGEAARPGHWPGHLVAVVLEQVVVDLSLPQFNRADKQIALAPVLFPAGAAFLAGAEDLSFAL